jgi:hypothetical protein
MVVRMPEQSKEPQIAGIDQKPQYPEESETDNGPGSLEGVETTIALQRQEEAKIYNNPDKPEVSAVGGEPGELSSARITDEHKRSEF